jgi:hypothetical protein
VAHLVLPSCIALCECTDRALLCPCSDLGHSRRFAYARHVHCSPHSDRTADIAGCPKSAAALIRHPAPGDTRHSIRLFVLPGPLRKSSTVGRRAGRLVKVASVQRRGLFRLVYLAIKYRLEPIHPSDMRKLVVWHSAFPRKVLRLLHRPPEPLPRRSRILVLRSRCRD